MDNVSLGKQVTGWSFNSQRTESGETHSESVSSSQGQEDKTETPFAEMMPVDASKEPDKYKMTTRDYLTALSLFFLTLLTYGNANSLPVLTVEWLQEFKDSKSLVLYVPELAFALTSAAGVIDGFLIGQFGIYKIIIFGCLLQIVCVFGSSFSTNAITLVIVLGFLLGTGSCYCYVNCFILMGLEFGENGKSLIAALSLAGPLAGLIYPNLISALIDQYTWRGGMIILAGIDLHMIPFALFLFLSRKHKKKKQQEEDAREKTNETDLLPLPAPKKTYHVSIFKDPLYVAYIFAVTFALSGILGTNGLFPSFIHKKGLKLEQAAQLYSIYRIISALPRALVGILLRCVKFRFIYVFIISASLFGVTSILINQVESYTTLIIFIIIQSLCMGAPAGLYSIGTLECVGPEKYSFAISVIETSYGIGVGLFGYLAGLLIEYLDSYQEVFCIFGATMIVFNIILLITALVQNWQNKKSSSEL